MENTNGAMQANVKPRGDVSIYPHLYTAEGVENKTLAGGQIIVAPGSDLAHLRRLVEHHEEKPHGYYYRESLMQWIEQLMFDGYDVNIREPQTTCLSMQDYLVIACESEGNRPNLNLPEFRFG